MVLLTHKHVHAVAHVVAVGLEQRDVLTLQVGLDKLTLKQPLERLDELEGGKDGEAVVEALVEHRAESLLELLD